jgi:hypothetical protein
MGIFDFLGKRCSCPACGRPFAWRLFGKVKCRHPGCARFDREYAEKVAPELAKLRAASLQSRPREGKFDPGENSVAIQYTNYLDVDGTYTGDRRTVKRSNEHISIRLAPTGERVTFARARIQNLGEVEQWIQADRPSPSVRERGILNYHKKKGTTSPLYEQIRQKYPDF